LYLNESNLPYLEVVIACYVSLQDGDVRTPREILGNPPFGGRLVADNPDDCILWNAGELTEKLPLSPWA
jgi:hypothetical protein